MRTSVVFFAAFLLLAAVDGFANYPIFSQRFTADPSPIVVNGRVYVFCTHDLDDQRNWWMNDFTCLSSDDLVNWTDHGEVFSATNDTRWADMAWAPQVVAANGKFYLYYTTGLSMGEGRKRGANATGVAVADAILGPYKDPLDKPLVVTGSYSDPTVLVDEDGGAYLYLNGKKMAKLNRDMISLAEPVHLVPDSDLQYFMEGPWITRINGKYNLSYSSCYLKPQGYSYMQAVSDRPDGGFKYKGMWFWMAADNKPNTHGGFFSFSGKTYMVYHNAAVAKARKMPLDFQRSIGIDRVYFNADGTIKPFTSTRDWMAQVRYVDPYARNLAVTMAAESGIETEPCSEGGRQVCSLQAGDWIKVQGVDFGKRAKTFQAEVAGIKGGSLEVCLDSLGSAPVAVCDVPPGDGTDLKWATRKCRVTGVAGVHDLYFRFTGGEGDLFVFKQWEFCGGKTGGVVPPATVEKTFRLKVLPAGMYVRVEAGTGLLKADIATSERAAAFRLVDNEDGTWSLVETGFGSYVNENNQLAALVGRKTRGRFVLYSNPDGSWCLARSSDGGFVRLDAERGVLKPDCMTPRQTDVGALWAIEDDGVTQHHNGVMR